MDRFDKGDHHLFFMFVTNIFKRANSLMRLLREKKINKIIFLLFLNKNIEIIFT